MTSQPIEETVFLQSDDYFDSLCADIAKAQKTIDMEAYTFEHDALGTRIANALMAAAQQGVQVRVLVDGAGTPNWGGALTKTMHLAGIQTRVFNPFPWRLWQWHHTIVKIPFLFKIFYFIAKINKRNHRKICIIDNKIVYVGSANIKLCHLCTEKGGQNWRDTTVRLTGIDVKELKAAFFMAWSPTHFHQLIRTIFHPLNPQVIFRLNNTRHKRRVLHKHLLRRLTLCKKRVWLTNAYFVPDNFLLKKLVDLAKKGVDVRILLPEKSDIFIMPWASSAFYERLLKAGVRIFEYLPSMLHAKSLILDDWFIVGSSNLNHRSLLHDLEVDAIIHSLAAKQQIEQQFLHDLTLSKEIQLGSWYKRSYLQRCIGRLLLYIKYWI